MQPSDDVSPTPEPQASWTPLLRARRAALKWAQKSVPGVRGVAGCGPSAQKWPGPRDFLACGQVHKRRPRILMREGGTWGRARAAAPEARCRAVGRADTPRAAGTVKWKVRKRTGTCTREGEMWRGTHISRVTQEKFAFKENLSGEASGKASWWWCIRGWLS
ncbi:uncharacterized protein LOC126940764 [Macaca thibetana thibetana]|uniref:uncharacterized protein LOC126940764 n=1 Tax=Macaca thibetana thibetana TaxID=257877 RepID=UPI0021BCB54F|nr:uncharacterized protein LOC126940764 [Macaca thibetana thibetana]